MLGDLLTVLIALEVLQNITSYLRLRCADRAVLVTALTAVARKVIVLPSGAEDKPQLLSVLDCDPVPCSGLLAGQAGDPCRTESLQCRASQRVPGSDPFSPHDDVDAAEDGDGHQH